MYTAVLLVKDYPIAIGIHHDSTHGSSTVITRFAETNCKSFPGFKFKLSGRDKTVMNVKVSAYQNHTTP